MDIIWTKMYFGRSRKYSLYTCIAAISLIELLQVRYVVSSTRLKRHWGVHLFGVIPISYRRHIPSHGQSTQCRRLTHTSLSLRHTNDLMIVPVHSKVSIVQ